MIRRLVFAERLPSSSAVDGQEAEAWLRLEWEVPQRGLRALRAWPAARTLADLKAEFFSADLPRFLDELLLLPEAAAVESEVPAQVEAWLAHRAPKSHALLQRRTQLRTRTSVYVIERHAPVAGRPLGIFWRPAGELALVPLRCPLLGAADLLARAELPSFGAALPPGMQAESVTLLRALIESRWLSRRLAPGLVWDALQQTYALRRSPAGPRCQEHLSSPSPEKADDKPAAPPPGQADPLGASGRRHADLKNPPGLLLAASLHCPGLTQAFELDLDPHDDLPFAVIRAALAWLLGDAPPAGTLYLDGHGRPPRDEPAGV
jgi:hypothetical protein